MNFESLCPCGCAGDGETHDHNLIERLRAERDALAAQISGYEQGRKVEEHQLGEAVYYCGLSVFYAVLGLKWVLKARRWWRA